MKEEIVYCGIDLAKEQLDVVLEQKHWQVGNQKAAISRLVKQLRQRAGIHVICEASGGVRATARRCFRASRGRVQPGSA